jgi:hypothetical protein
MNTSKEKILSLPKLVTFMHGGQFPDYFAGTLTGKQVTASTQGGKDRLRGTGGKVGGDDGIECIAALEQDTFGCCRGNFMSTCNDTRCWIPVNHY